MTGVAHFILTRQAVGKDFIKGVMELVGTSFSCYTLEAKNIEGHTPKNPTFSYALPKGDYPLKISAKGYMPFVPVIKARPYRNICFENANEGFVKAGSVGVGTEFIGTKILLGYEDVMEGFARIVRREGLTQFYEAYITIKDSPNIDYIHDEEVPLNHDETLNFANL